LASGGPNKGNDSAANHDLLAIRQTVDFLKADPPEPFFMFLPGIGAHTPYGAPSDYQVSEP
jgi:hypothetical protein